MGGWGWVTGVLEYWSNGVMEYWGTQITQQTQLTLLTQPVNSVIGLLSDWSLSY